jgi:hypothetical protein
MAINKAIRKLLRKVKRSLFSKKIFPDHIDQAALISQAADFFNQPIVLVTHHYQTYRQFHEQQGYEVKFGERKTLCFEEAFLLYEASLQLKPKNFVEIGTQHGKSTRRIIDLLQLANLNSCQITCFDIANQVKYFTQEECQLELHDVTDNFTDVVLKRLKPQVIYLDAHPYQLLYNVIFEFLNWASENASIIAIHDCSPMLYNKRMRINRKDSAKITSQTGVWERHVLAEIFQTPNEYLDDVRTSTHHLRIFPTPHGLAMIKPTNL